MSYKILLIFIMLTFVSFGSFAQDLSELSLEELMDVKVKVATQSEKSLREAPGIITVIDQNQIKKSGFRDLLEILSSVPGITFGQDVLGNVSIIMRGIWAQEGRILLLIDGIEMNERSYGTLQLAHHYPADHIKRIEIIRGPGSAIYGGVAELGVINVITKDGADLKGIEASTSYGRTSKEFSNSTTSFMLGNTTDKLKFGLKGMFNQASTTDRSYTDENGARGHLGNGNSNVRNEHLNLKLEYSDFYFTMIKDNYRTKNILLWGDLENNPGSGNIRSAVPKEYTTDAYQIGYQKDVSDDLNLHVYFSNKVQLPYFQPDAGNDLSYGNSWRRRVQRNVYGIRSKYHLNAKNEFQFGVEQSEDKSWSLNRLNYSGTPDTFGNGRNVYEILNTGMFGQYDLASDIVNLTIGIRYDRPTVTHDTLVPRFGLTKVLGKSHVKALFAQAFKAPLVENISLNKNIRPEITTTTELEYGYTAGPDLNWTLNLFSTRVKDIIVYSYDTLSSTEHYNNYDLVKTIGLETELRYTKSIHEMRFNFSTYKVDSLKAPPFKTGQDSSALIGSPTQKFYFADFIHLSENTVLTPSLTYLVNNNSYHWSDSTFKEKRLKDQLIGNLFLRQNNIFMSGLSAGLGINNLFNSDVYYSQPYVKEGDFRASPYPGQSREYVVRLDYKKEF